MSTADHVTQLTEKHHRIEEKIQNEMASPSADHVHISKLKREKLRLKEKISMLSSEENLAH
ncbi:YdcH family protein [Sneathiella sp.]|uniref:YdcH family protein n=1 Tax=Sneathiella sp. TaxID=1964365 RepID=UPI0035632CA5